MDNGELRTAQRAFINLSQAVVALEKVFQRMCTNMADIQERLDRLEQRPSKHPIVTFFDGSQSTLPPGFDIVESKR